MIINKKEYITTTEAMEMMECTRTYIRDLVLKEKLKYIKSKGTKSFLFLKKDILNFIKNRDKKRKEIYIKKIKEFIKYCQSFYKDFDKIKENLIKLKISEIKVNGEYISIENIEKIIDNLYYELDQLDL